MVAVLGIRSKKRRAVGIPSIDMSMGNKCKLSEQMVEACEEFGFFKVVNHGVSKEVITRMEKVGIQFFGKTASEKQAAAGATPFGYGCKNIGVNGDMGELEYLLVQANPQSISETCNPIITAAADPTIFSCAVSDYVEAMKELGRQILDVVAEGLCILDKSRLSGLITNPQSDSCFRLNHYPPHINDWDDQLHSSSTIGSRSSSRVGFGEHTDPQILTILRSNDVGGLQICTHDGLWVPVPPDPTQFYVFVGDAFQALTNGRFRSVRHRVMANSSSLKARMSMMYFGAPPLHSSISPLLPSHLPLEYRAFTWAEYKKAAYSLRLGDRRIDLFQIPPTPQTTTINNDSH